MTPCNPGYYSLGSTDECTECPTGYSCPSRGASPVICPVGTYSTTGSVVCTASPAGYYVASPGSAGYSVCALGTYSTTGASVCTDCSPGYACPAGSTSPSPLGSACAIGGYCSSATGWTYTSCPTGYYGVTAAGQTLAHACKACEPGYYCPTEGGTIEDRVQCPAGYYCTFANTNAIACPAGYYSSLVGQTSIGTCTVCPIGTYCVHSGTASPTVCPAGYFCPQETIDYTNNPCPSGTYSDVQGINLISQCNNCTEGHYCPGDTSPVPCPAGRYNTLKGIGNVYDCRPCEPGYACTSTGMSTSTVTSCAAGYYCPSGTTSATEYPCPSGRYSDSVSLSGYAQCTTCTPGNTCIPACKSSDIVPCATGSYCPEGTQSGQDIPCPAGTYTAYTYLYEEEQCSSCPSGYYCSGGGSTTSGACAAGHYCPTNTTSSTDYPCVAGRYTASTSLGAAAECDQADPGYYATSGQSAQVACPTGRYTAVYGTEDYYASAGTTTYCLECSAGYYCTAGVSAMTPCGAGYYSASGSSVCTICPVGTYCADTVTTDSDITDNGGTWDKVGDLSGVCFNGTLCENTGRTSMPDLVNDYCPAGYYCPSGSSTALPCPAGTYNPLSGKYQLEDCLDAEAGYYSVAAATATAGLCYPGYYCPAKSTGPMQMPCIAGTYRSDYGGTDNSDCAACPAGSYCPKASVTPLLCPRGYFCPTGTSEPEPCAPGTYGNVAGLHEDHECSACDPGYYCASYALQAPTGLCAPGFYCLSGQNTSTPISAYPFVNTTSDVCPQGSYCPIGTVLPIDCPVGTFNPSEGGTSTADCTTCTAGYYCEGLGNIYPDGECNAGYYCTGGSDTPTQYETEAGYFTVAGSSAMSPCSVGYYQDHVAQSACVDCPAGYYCPTTAMTNVTMTPCPAGYYCPLNSVNPTACNIGKYAPYEGNTQVSDCLDCTAGYYCDSQALSAPTAVCDAGYYCTAAATMAVQASDTATGGRCPAGKYCLAGTGTPVDCPVGTYMASMYNTGSNAWVDMDGTDQETLCTPCDNGMACATVGLTAPDTTCGAGYWCNLAATQANADCTNNTECGGMYDICPMYYHCPSGSSEPVTCAAGYYTTATGQSTCIDCPSGYYCLGDGQAPSECPAGSYCPTNTEYSNQYVCPVGKYSALTGLEAVGECEDCAAGSYCPNFGSGVPEGLCSAGYFCGGGSSTATPADSYGYALSYVGDTCVNATKANTNDVCPVGHYCPEGSIAPTVCPPGTLSPSAGLTNVSSCPLCPSGYYCPYGAMTDSGLNCPAGTYCPAGSEATTVCPAGHYCPVNSADAIACAGGYYNANTGSTSISACLDCPTGYYCPEGATETTVCPVGRYCPVNAPIGTYCTNGTYATATGLQQQEDCTDCPEKQFCHTGAIQGNCSAGYFCKGGADSATPDQNITAYNTSLIGQMYFLKSQDNAQCPPGYYCPEGNTDPLPCPSGTVYQYTTASSEDDCGECPTGYYCLDGSPTPVLCDRGYYCPYGTTQATQEPCPVLTYGAAYGLTSAAECTVCPAGYACNSTGIADYTMWPCPVGYYCPTAMGDPQPCPGGTYMPTTGSDSTNDCIACPAYHYCPAASASIMQCPEGYYCSGENSESGTICPAGYYCPTNTTTPIDCPQTYYCAAGSFAPSKCWVGTYCPTNSIMAYSCPLGYIGVNATGTNHLDDVNTACEACPAGKYGADPDRLTCSYGTAGYVFYGGTTSATPSNVTSDNGEPCPAGYYCEGNTTAATACPTGTYNSLTTQVSSAACISCPANSYSNAEGAAACSACSSSSSAAAGSTECTCKGNNRAFQPNDGYCICKPGYEFVDTDFTVQSEEDGSIDCQPIVYSRCNTDQTRNDLGVCMDTYTSCDTFCTPYSGEVSSATGLCICDVVTPLAEVCDADCRADATVVSCLSSTTILITYPTTGLTETVAITDYSPSSGSIDCSVTNSKILSMTTTGGAFAGVFGAPSTVTDAARRRRRLLEDGSSDISMIGTVNGSRKAMIASDIDVSTFYSADSEVTQRRLETDAELSNPAVCISAGDSIVFDVTSDAYPVYVKDSLVNTNSEFDYAAFRDLAELCESSSLTISSFAFTFTESGNYVFQISDATDMMTIISVVADGTSCTSDASFDVMTSGTLVTLGISSSSSIVLAPDWAVLVGLILGIVALVVLLISFMYYFRKMAWNSHIDVHSSQRLNKSSSVHPDASKGGLFSDHGRKNNKVVPALTDFDEDARGPDVAAEVERAMELQDYADVDFDDDMLIPELAKHVQAQHDDVAKRLDKTQGQVKGLQDTFTKELDDLKALLNATALQMTSAGGSEAAKVKKLRALLLEVKKNTSDRSAFAGYCAITEIKLQAFVGGLQRLIDIGADKTAIDIVDELNDDAITCFDKGEQRDNDAYESSIYYNIGKDLTEIKSFYEEVIKAGEHDDRSVKIADDAFEESLELAQVAFPQNIRNLMTVAGQAMVDEKDKEGQVWGLLKAFVDRAPRFNYAMDASCGVLCRSLKTHIEEGHLANCDEDKLNARNEMAGYLNDLIAALLLVQEKLGERVAAAADIRDDSNVCRQELMAAIDAELGFLGDGDSSKDISKLIKALKEGGLGPLGGDDDDEEEEEEEEEEVKSVKKQGKKRKAAVVEDDIVNDDVFDDIDGNDKLEADKKEELLQQAQNDQMIANSNLAREEQAKKDMLAALQKEHSDADIGGDKEEAPNHENELSELQSRQEDTRDDKLRAMERAEYSASLAAGDSPHTVRVSTLATNRYVSIMRCLAADVRVSFYELEATFAEKRAKGGMDLLAKDGNRYRNANAVYVKADTDVTNGALMALADHEALQIRLDAEEKKAAAKLRASLHAQYEKRMVAEDKTKEQWLNDPAAVNCAEVMIALRSECNDLFKSYNKRRITASERYTTAAANESQIQMTLVDIKASAETLDDEKKAVLHSAFSQESETRVAVAQKSSDDLGRILDTEEFTLGHILNLADSWGPKVDSSSLQRDLFERLKYDTMVEHDLRSRLARLEAYYRNEIVQITTESDLNKRAAEQKEVQLVFSNLEDGAKESFALLEEHIEADGKHRREQESKRQEQSCAGYEAERYLSVEDASFNTYQLSLDVESSLRTISKEMKQAMEKKKTDLIQGASQQEMSDEVKKLSMQQIDEESLMEEAKIAATYTAMVGQSQLSRRLSAEVTQGAYPSVDWGEKEIDDYTIEGTAALKESLVHNAVRRSYKRKFSVARTKVYENLRLMSLDRDASELDRIYSRLDENLSERLELIETEWQGELSRLTDTQNAQSKEMKAAHADFHDEVYMVLSEHESAVGEHDAAMAAKLEEAEHADESDDEVKDRGILIVGQDNARLLCALLGETDAKVFSAFKKYHSRVFTLEKVEDDLRHYNIDALQNAEALENALDNERNSKFRKLLADQIAAREKQRELRDQYDMELNGLDAAMKAKKERQKKFLADRLAKRKKSREEELIDQGMDAAEAKAVAAAEAAAEDARCSKNIEDGLEEEQKKARRKMNEGKEELENDVMDKYKKALKVSEDGLAAAKKRERDALEARLKAKRDKRMKELMAGGMSEADAKKQVAKELKKEAQEENAKIESSFDDAQKALQNSVDKLGDDLESGLKDGLREKIATIKADSKLSEDQKRAAIKKAQNDFNTELARIKDEQERARSILTDGLENAKRKEKQSLMDRLAAKKKARTSELATQGKSNAEAADQADAEMGKEMKQEEAALDNHFKIAKSMLDSAAADDWHDKMTGIKTAHENKLQGLDNALGYNKGQQSKNLQDRLKRKKNLRKQMLTADGLSKEEIDKKLDAEFSKAEAAADEDAVERKMRAEIEASKQTKTNSLQKMDAELKREEGAASVSADDDVVKMLERQLAEAKSKLEEANSRATQHYSAASEAAKNGAGAADDELKALRGKHDEAVAKLQDDFEAKRKEKEASMQRKLAMRRKKKEAMLNNQNKNKVDADAAPIEVQAAVEAQTTEAGKALEADLQDAMAAIEKDATLTAAQKQARKQQAEQDHSEELSRMKEQASRAAKILEDGFANAKDNEKKSIAARLAKRKGNREKEIQKTGKSASEAAAIAEREMSELKQIEELQLEADFAECKEMIDGTTAPIVSDEEIARRLASDSDADAASLRKATEIQSQIDEERSLAELNRKQAELEKAVVEREQAQAAAASEAAAAAEANAQAQLDALKKQQEDEMQKLTDTMGAAKKKKGEDLKKRLADKKAAKMKELETAKASDLQKAEAEAQLEQEQHQAQLAAEAAEAEETAARVAALKAKQDAAEEEAKKAVADAEMEAAIAATKAAALESIQETQKRTEDEINQREVDRLKSLHEELAAKAKAESEQTQADKKGKLADRIKAKRDKKAREMKDKEAAETAALVAKQAADEEERERLKLSKMQWSEHLKAASDKADEAGIAGAEYEDFCIKETIGKNLVPPQHLAECIGRILAPRHRKQTSDLMEANFDKRIGAVKKATSAVLEEKNLERVDTVQRMKDGGADDAAIDNAMTALEDHYTEKQRDAERKAVSVLEEESLASQMKLRQQQLEDVSKLVTLNSDPDTLKQLQKEGEGKSMVEEMADYRAKLEKERKDRAEAMAKEREEEEARMKSKMEAEMAAMRERLAADAKAAEDEFARKKAEMEAEIAKQKAAMEAKAEAANNDIDKEEQARIREQFEKESESALKELDNAKKKKKDKLAERLAAKRNKQKLKKEASGVVPPPTDAPPSDLTDSADAVASAANDEEEGGGDDDADREPISPEKKKWSESGAVVKAIKKKSKSAASEAGVSPQLAASLELVVQRMDKIEGLLGQMASQPLRAVAAAAGDVAAAPATPAALKTFSDITEPAAGISTVLMEDRSLHMQQKSKLEFGRRLASMLDMPEVQLVAASSLPPPSPPLSTFGGAGSSAITNPFARSYSYDAATKQLAVHVDRLGSSGDFGLVLVHALSHIKTNPHDLTNDQDATFMQEFYKNLKVINQDLYREVQSKLINGGRGGINKQDSSSADSGTASGKFRALKKMGSKLLEVTSNTSAMMGAEEKRGQVTEYYSSSALEQRMLEYAKSSGVSIPSTYLQRYTEERSGGGDSSTTTGEADGA